MTRRTEEDQAQAAVVQWLRAFDYTPIASLNGTKLTGSDKLARIRQWAKILRLGGRKGAPDLIIIEPAPIDGHPTAIEMKSKTGEVSPSQREVHEIMRAAGWHVVIGFGASDAINQLECLGFDQRKRGAR